MIMLHTELQKSDISGKVLPFTLHLEVLFLALVEFTYYWKVSQLTQSVIAYIFNQVLEIGP